MSKTYLHSGDLGDAIYALHAIKALGGGHIYLVTRPQTKAFTVERLQSLIPLLEAQDYISGVTAGEPEQKVDYDFSTFRQGGHPFGVSLAELQALWVTRPEKHLVGPPTAAWLDAGIPDYNGRVVVHRSPRYNNANFPWKKLAAHYGDRMLAIGFPEEVKALEAACGRKLEFAATANHFEMAQLIAGASLFIGNQSSPMAVAIGLGIPVMQETCYYTPDCVYPALPIQYVYDGSCTTIPVDGVDAVMEIKRVFRAAVDRACVPPGGWQYPHPDGAGRIYRNNIFGNLVAEAWREALKRGDNVSREEFSRLVEDYNALRLPNFWPSPGDCFRGVRDFLHNKGVQVA